MQLLIAADPSLVLGHGKCGAPVVGFDLDQKRLAEFRASRDRTNDVAPEELGVCACPVHVRPERHRDVRLLRLRGSNPDRRGPTTGPRGMTKATGSAGRVLKRGDSVARLSMVERISGAPVTGGVCGRCPARASRQPNRFRVVVVVAPRTPEIINGTVFQQSYRAPTRAL